MNFGAFFKVIAFVAPTLAFVFYYVAQQQDKQEAKIEERNVNFDRDFAQMNAEFEGEASSGYWSERKQESEDKIQQTKEKVKVTEVKSAKMLEEMDQGLSELSADDLRELRGMANVD